MVRVFMPVVDGDRPFVRLYSPGTQRTITFRRLLVTPPLVVLCSSSPWNWSLSTAPHRFYASCFSSVSTYSHRQKLSAHIFCTTRHIIFSESAKTRSFLLRLGEAFIHRGL